MMKSTEVKKAAQKRFMRLTPGGWKNETILVFGQRDASPKRTVRTCGRRIGTVYVVKEPQG